MKIDVIKESVGASGIPCICIVRNEIYFLPHFLDHYRRIGVRRFLFYDDNSSDGSREYLLKQDDCTILRSDYQFQQMMGDGRPFHYHARTFLRDTFAGKGWCLTVDADEFLFLPERYASLQDVASDLDRRGHISVLAPMVELYPETLNHRRYADHLGPFDGVDWWFDKEPGFVRDIADESVRPVPRGIRVRLLEMLSQHCPELVPSIYGGAPSYAKLWKMPLVRAGFGLWERDSHSLNIPPPLDVQLALAHFKFYPGTDKKVREALDLKNHYRGSTEYRFLAAVLERFGDEKLIGHQSVRFKSGESFEEAGLMFTDISRGKDVGPLTQPVPAGKAAKKSGKTPGTVTVEKLFATPLVIDHIDDPARIAALEKVILERRAVDPGITRSNLSGWHSDDGLLHWGGEPARELARHVIRLANAETVLKDSNPGQGYEWSAIAWANVNQTGASNALHSHGGNFWSAVFYVRVDPGTGGELVLRDPRSPGIQMYAPTLWFANAGIEREGVISPTVGTLLIFPSWLEHSVRPYHGDGLRISIAFNLGVSFTHATRAAAPAG